MNKKATLYFATSGGKLQVEDNSTLAHVPPGQPHSEKESLNIFRENIRHLTEEVNRLSFMITEIRSVLESSSTKNRFLA